MAQFIAPAIQGSWVEGEDRLLQRDSFLDMMRDGDMVEMDVGESLGWVRYGRHRRRHAAFLRLGKVTRLDAPAFIFDKSNVATAGKPATFNDGYGDAHIAASRSSGA